jgi:TolB-like protein
MTVAKAVEVSLALLTVTLLCGEGTEVWGASQRTVAVLYLENNSVADRASLDPLEKGLTDMLITELSKIEGLKVVERARLQALVDELHLGLSGMVDSATAQQIGKLLGAQTLVMGGFVKGFDGKLRIDVRLVDVETGRTLTTDEETDKPKHLFKMIKRMSKAIAEDLEVKLTKADKKRLKETDNTSFAASVWYARGLNLEDQGKVEEAVKMYEQALRENPGYARAKARLDTLRRSEECQHRGAR